MATSKQTNHYQTEHMFIGSDSRLRKISNEPNIFLDHNPLSRVSKAKTLGVTIDERMTWSSYVDHICKKISSGLSVLRLVRDSIPQDNPNNL